MLTPQQLEEIAFNTATFGGYDKMSVDEFLEPLIDDYVTLYKENALLKSKMRVLVGKLEEYRSNEASIQSAMDDTQKACDQMVMDTEAKCAQMIRDANQAAAENAKNADAFIQEENARVEDARRAASEKIQALQHQLRSCLDALEIIRIENRPAPADTTGDAQSEEKTNAMADEIAHSLEELVGTTNDTAIPAPKPAEKDAPTGKFKNLQFGRNHKQ